LSLFLKFWYIFAEFRYLVPIIVCVKLGWWWLFGGFCLMYFLDLEPIRSRWETGKLSYAAHVARHGIMFKLLQVSVWFLVEKKTLYAFLIIYLIWLASTARPIRRVFNLSDVSAVVLLGILGVAGACLILPFSYEMSWLNSFASFALMFEFILIIRHIVQYQPGLKAPPRPK